MFQTTNQSLYFQTKNVVFFKRGTAETSGPPNPHPSPLREPGEIRREILFPEKYGSKSPSYGVYMG
jgi:hypothetical protein